MLARKTSKNQLTLPKEIVVNFPGVDFFDATVEENRIVLTPVRVVPVTATLERRAGQDEKVGLGAGRCDRGRSMGKREAAPLRVVVDTNVLLSALLFGGQPGRLRDLWVEGRIVPLVSQETFAEFSKVLYYPKFDLASGGNHHARRRGMATVCRR